MGFLSKIISEPEGEDINETNYLEIDDIDPSHHGKFMIRVETLSEFSDTSVIQEYVRNGDIVWVRIKPLKEKDITELKRAVDRLRKTCVAINGDVAGIDEDYLVLTPPGVSIHRR
ncbi:MAG: cell division protein SepF [Candidatus Aenigmarchaeota archaeon]|nr:cell division protein SepF [Candidatus Aenigmarchaeota archaeon]